MTNQRVANRYAKSLVELAVERNQLDRIKQDVDALLAMGKNRDFVVFLNSPVVPPSKKKAILATLLEKAGADELTKLYVKLIVDKGREVDLLGILKEFNEQYKVINHISTVKLTSAAPLTAATLDSIKQQLVKSGRTQATIDLETVIDPSLLGGFILEFDGQVYDASAVQKLKEMRTELQKPNLHVNQLG